MNFKIHLLFTSNITHRATIIYNIAKDHLGHTIVTRPNKAAEEPKDGSGTVGLRSSVNSNAASWPNVDRPPVLCKNLLK